MAGQTVLKALLRERHLQDHKAFCREFGRIARSIDPGLANSQPSKATLYRWMSGDLRRLPHPGACRVLEQMFPGWTAVELFKPWSSPQPPQPPSRTHVIEPAPTSHALSAIRSALPIDTVAGYWVTGYEFSELGNTLCHVDISCVRPRSDRQATITNYLPAPRTENHSPGFRNIVEIELVGRHLIGFWKNTNDDYYFGTVHAAVLPGENVIEGWYTGFTNDMDMAAGPWKWVRLAPESIDGQDLEALSLLEPRLVFRMLKQHSRTDGPITLDRVTEPR